MVPKGWSSQKLSSVASIIDCKHRTPEYVKSGIPLVSPGTIKWGALDLISPVKRVTEEEYRSLMDHCVVEQGDLVMSRNQSVGVVSYVDSKKPFVLGQDTVLIKAIHADWRFIYYTLQSDLVQRQIAKSAGGSTFSRINLSDIRALNINTPAICEQDKISQILTAWDKAISVTEKLLANSQRQKKALMQQLLTGKKRLLDENGVRFSGDWGKFTLSHFGKCIRGVSYKPENICENESDNTIRLLRSTNIQNGELNDKDLIILPKKLVKPMQVLMDGDLAICMANGSKSLVGKSAPYKPNDADYTIGAFCALFRPLKSVSSSFVKFLFESNQYQSQLLVILAGSSINNLKGSDIESINIDAPLHYKEQQKIAAVLSVADAEISTLEKKLACLKDEKKALMQQLLTGKRRVKVDEAVAV